MLRDNRNQTIIVSGESGAGKTVSAKYIMRYFATRESPDRPALKNTKRAKPVGGTEPTSETEDQILATNPIMEAFGNAKTTRNDNSSRFGKYIQIMFDKQTEIIGAEIRTYLLERSRLVFQPLRERNYHIFYQLLAGATESERHDLSLGGVDEYHYLNQGNCPLIDGVDDKSEFALTRHSLSTIGVDSRRQAAIFRILAALLHVGNIAIDANRSHSSLEPTESSLCIACQLLGIDAGDFAKWTVKKQLITRGERIISNLTASQATVVRDSVAKYIYSSLFDWLVSIINNSLATPDVISKSECFIGVLDIYGFEHFTKNSFEQFCINYANEKLQQEFNQHVFKLEQEEYIREQIDWKFIDFSDNQLCIDLIEGKMGILSLLDEESRLPMGSDEQFANKLHHNFHNNHHQFFKKPRFGKSAFTVCHYALDVTYESEGFIDKNRDTVPDEHIDLLKTTTNSFLSEVLESSATVRERDVGSSKTVPAPGKKSVLPVAASGSSGLVGRRAATGSNRKPTLGGIFKSSLIELMNTINSTDVHYIRCIKPNEAKEAWKFEGPMVLSQLRACGVLETVRISCAGYPTRWTYEEFAMRYYMLVPSSDWTDDCKTMADTILKRTLLDSASEANSPDKYQLGLTKIFFRAGMLAFLEEKRTSRLNSAAITIQKHLRGRYYRKKYLDARQSVIALQSLCRGFLSRSWALTARKNRLALMIQTQWRAQQVRSYYLSIRKIILAFQARSKGYVCRKLILDKRLGDAARLIQRTWRKHSQLSSWRSYRRKVVLIQCLWRGRAARKEYRILRQEARDLKQFSYKLESKVVELTQAVERWKVQYTASSNRVEQLEGQIKTMRNDYNKLEQTNRDLQLEAYQAGRLSTELNNMSEQFQRLKDSYEESQSTMRRLEAEEKALRVQLDEARQRTSTEEKAKLSLTKDLADIRDQLDMAKRLAPFINGGLNTDAASAPSDSNAHPSSGTLLHLVTNRRAKRRSAIDVANATHLNDADYSPRPVSMAVPGVAVGQWGSTGASNSADGSSPLPHTQLLPETIESELDELLSQVDGLNLEVMNGLIKNLTIPSPESNPTPKEVLFPAYLINLTTSEMWNNGYVTESQKFLTNVLKSIQDLLVLSHDTAKVLDLSPFWLSNVHEILSFVLLAEEWYLSQKENNHSYSTLLEIVKHDLESLEFNIYHIWMKALKSTIHKKIVPAVIESQSLPGFITNETNRFLGKLISNSNQSLAYMDSLISDLNRVSLLMKSYYLEDVYVEQVITELVHLIGVMAFNDLLMRRNFLSWKRGLQISYNITRIEEWCENSNLQPVKLKLEALKQATKLLQLKKSTLNDIEIIQDICWM